MASSSNAASGPKIMSTLSRSTSSWVLVLVPAGLPPVSATTSSTLRPARLWFRSFRNRMVPCSIWMPPAASGPVLTVSRPMRTGLGWAIAGNARDAVTAAPAAPARNSRRRTLTAISRLLFDSVAPWGSVALGQAQHVLGQVVENHLLRDRRDLVETHLAPEPLDVEFLRVAVAAVGLQRDVARLEAGLGRHQLGRCRRATPPSGTSTRPSRASPRRARAGARSPDSGRSAGRRPHAPSRTGRRGRAPPARCR